MNKQLLVNRRINTAEFESLPDSWYASLEYFKGFKSVADVRMFDTTSSAGDWGGYILQKIGKRSYVITFYQENNYPYKGFTVWTRDNPVISFLGEMDSDEILSILNELQQL